MGWDRDLRGYHGGDDEGGASADAMSDLLICGESFAGRFKPANGRDQSPISGDRLHSGQIIGHLRTSRVVHVGAQRWDAVGHRDHSATISHQMLAAPASSIVRLLPSRCATTCPTRLPEGSSR